MTVPLRRSTVIVHGGHSPDPSTGSVAPPLMSTSTFVHGNAAGLGYGRTTNPVWERLEALLTELEEGAGAVVTASGMAAISACIDLVPVGARVVAPSNGYSGCRVLLRHLHDTERVEASFVDITDTEAVAAAVRPGGLLHLEAITNPMLTVPDLRACIAAAHAVGALVVVDNTVTTPLLLRPLALGADLVVHSLTKYVGGHTDLIAGAVVARDEALLQRLRFLRTEVGGIPGALEAWLALRGARTLGVRFERQQATAAELARRLEGHPDLDAVVYPGLPGHPQHERARTQLDGGFGALVGIVVRGGVKRADAVCEATRLWVHTTSLGGVESMLERRSRYDVDAEVCPPGLVRLSVGLEDPEDLLSDLDAALVSTRALATGSGEDVLSESSVGRRPA